jgi:hypothetical protein
MIALLDVLMSAPAPWWCNVKGGKSFGRSRPPMGCSLSGGLYLQRIDVLLTRRNSTSASREGWWSYSSSVCERGRERHSHSHSQKGAR